VIEFKLSKQDKVECAAQMYKRTCGILKQENVEYDRASVAEVVKKHFPDNRRILNELQRYSATGSIDSGILSNLEEVTIDNLFGHLKEKDFTSVRKWVAERSEADTTALFRSLYDKANDHLEPNSIPQLVLILADYQYKDAFVADHEINITACLTEIMANCHFK
jgi:ABC-type enterochelin transport system ATPase subunit